MVKKFGLQVRKLYIQFIWKKALKQWLKHNPKPLNKLGKQLNKINNELRQIRSSKEVL